MGSGDVDTGEQSEVSGQRLARPEAWKAHVTLAVGLALCAVAFWFEIGRALGGNALSWAYVFEWPLLGIFSVYMWWQVIHPRDQRHHDPPPSIAPEFEGMLAAWELHQAQLRMSQETSRNDGESS